MNLTNLFPILFELLGQFIKNAQNIVNVKWIWWACPPLFTIVCFLYSCITNPEGAINQFMITILSSVLVLFPSTPENFKIGSLLAATAQAFPAVGWGPVFEIYQGALGIFTISLLVRVWKFLPFT